MPNKWVTVSMRLSRLFFLYKFHVSFAVAVITIRFWPMRKLVLGVRAPISIVLLRKVNKFASIIYCYCVRLWLSDGGSRRMKYKRIPSKRRWSHHVERQSKCCNCKTGDFNFTFFFLFLFSIGWRWRRHQLSATKTVLPIKTVLDLVQRETIASIQWQNLISIMSTFDGHFFLSLSSPSSRSSCFNFNFNARTALTGGPFSAH